MTLHKLNSRKLLVAIVTFAACSWLLVFDHLDSKDFSTITLAIVGAYMAAQGFVDGKETK